MLTRTLMGALALVVALVGCTRPPPPPTPPAPKPVVVTPRVLTPDVPPADFDDAGRRDRVLAMAGELDAMFAEQREALKLPALAVGVVLDGELVFARGYGTRDDAGAPVDRDTVFRIGSITKVITGMALLLLRDEGKLSLEAPAATYLPALNGLVYPSGDSAPITVGELISHDAGLPRGGAFARPSNRAPTAKEVLDSFDGFRLRQAPGFGPHYSNVGVGLLALLIGRITGMRYRDFVTQRLLQPMGMTASRWDAAEVSAGRLALAHGAEGKPLATKDHWHLGAAEADGGLYASVADLAKLTAVQLDAWPPRSAPERGPLRRSTLRQSQRIRVFGAATARWKDDEEGPNLRLTARGVGVAWQVAQTCSIDHLVWHNGGTEGYRSVLVMAPKRGVGFVALTNSRTSVDALAMRTLRKLVTEARLPRRVTRPSKQLELKVAEVGAFAIDGTIDEASYREHFDPAFRDAISRKQMADLFGAVQSSHGRCSFERYIEVTTAFQAKALFRCEDGTEHEVFVVLSASTPMRINTFYWRNAQPPKPKPARCRETKAANAIPPPP